MVTIDARRQVPLFAELSDEQLQWLTEQGTEVWLQPGEFHRKEGDPATIYLRCWKGRYG